MSATTIPGTCECGCGQPTTIAKANEPARGRVKGQPMRFRPGHNSILLHATRTELDPPAEVAPDVPRCRRCPYPMVTRGGRVPRGWRVHNARGLCEMCYRKAAAAGEVIDYERLLRTRDELLDEWVLLRTEGYTRAQAAGRLGMLPESFDRALNRARLAGDPRALHEVETVTCSCGTTFDQSPRERRRKFCDECRAQRKRDQRRSWGRTEGTAAMRRYRARQRGEYVPDRRWSA